MPSLNYLARGQTPHGQASFPGLLRLASPFRAALAFTLKCRGMPWTDSNKARLLLPCARYHLAYHKPYLLARGLSCPLPALGFLTQT